MDPWCVMDGSMDWSPGGMAVEIPDFQECIQLCPGFADGLIRPYTARCHDALGQSSLYLYRGQVTLKPLHISYIELEVIL